MHSGHPIQSAGGELVVVTAISNPKRFQSRYRLYHEFAKRVHDAGAKLLTVEVAFGDRAFEVTEHRNPWHLRLRTWHELWHKENALNLGVNFLSRIMPKWEYVAWIDADITFCRPDWVNETKHLLQHYMVLQMFKRAHDLGPDHSAFDAYDGFVYSYFNKRDDAWLAGHDDVGYPQLGWHPGYAWAWRREAWESVGGLIDCAILGSADQHMARALVGRVRESINPRMHCGYLRAVDRWQELAERFIRRDVGYMDGDVIHHWHGKKKDRGYLDRWKILRDHQYDPNYDVIRDAQGLWQLYDDGTGRSVLLRDKIRQYFSARNEDSIDTE